MSVTDQDIANAQNAVTKPVDSTSGKIVYILFMLAPIFGGITALVGLIWAYVARGGSNEFNSSHLTVAIRTFWISLLFGVGVALSTLILSFISSLLFISLGAVSGLMYLLIFCWYYARLIKGLIAFSNGQNHPNPKTWLF